MLGTVTETADHLAGILSRLEAGTLSGEQASVLLREFARIERLAAAAVGLLAQRVEQTHQWRRHGHRSAAEHLAAQTGLGVGEAHGRLDTAHRLGDLPATAAAYRNGELSQVQAREVTAAGITDPTSEQHLLDTARTRGVKRLKEQAERVKAAAHRHEMTNYNAVRATRYLRRVTHPDGVKGLSIRATNDDLATILTAIKARTEARFHQARRQGQREHPDAYALDALVALCHDQLGTHQTTTTRQQPQPNHTQPPNQPDRPPDPARRPTRNGDKPPTRPATTPPATTRPAAAADKPATPLSLTTITLKPTPVDNTNTAEATITEADIKAFLDHDGSVVLSATDRALHHRAQHAAYTDRAAGKTPPHQDLRATIERAAHTAQGAAPTTAAKPDTDCYHDRDKPEEPGDTTPDHQHPDHQHLDHDGCDTVISQVTRGAGPKTTIQYRVDHAAYQRGYTIPGEISEIIGYGPIPVNVIRAASSDTIITALLTNGTDVQRVAHIGRTIPTHIRRAIEERDERRCVVCSSADRVEIDHYQIDYHRHGPTEMWNLCTLCKHHHNLKTHKDFKITGGPGNWHYHPPDHTPTPTCCPVTPTNHNTNTPTPASPNAPPDHERDSHERVGHHDHNRVDPRVDPDRCADTHAQQPPLW